MIELGQWFGMLVDVGGRRRTRKTLAGKARIPRFLGFPGSETLLYDLFPLLVAILPSLVFWCLVT